MTMPTTPAIVSGPPDLQRLSRQREWLWAFLLIALVFVSYARVFNAGFIWDDESHLTQNPCIVGPLGLKEVWTSASGSLLPAGAYDFLDFAQVRRPFALAIPSSKCAFARGISCLALAGLATTECSGRLAGSGAMGFAPGDGPISRLGNRAEKHAIGLLLSVVRLLFFEIGVQQSKDGRYPVRSGGELESTAPCFLLCL